MVRIGIHLGPVNIVKDMNGQSNMVGDGINDAQRIMSFASSDTIYISRSYYDVVSRLSTEYANLFVYRGLKTISMIASIRFTKSSSKGMPTQASLRKVGNPVSNKIQRPFPSSLNHLS